MQFASKTDLPFPQGAVPCDAKEETHVAAYSTDSFAPQRCHLLCLKRKIFQEYFVKDGNR